ncbi:hypothetical protein [Gottfriedia solisilvae]|uniref:Uncharacterized protein n=1 Tax=Gottfriedia solisilvae TaxID=1516104 RepID=A0A8J3AD38_9BACI|nr:hypothetical protein [Gottfriedia solisilvae]GGI11820.1 hypothetical protein GCM10007380_09760 [Gottfriedia solisilvae]
MKIIRKIGLYPLLLAVTALYTSLNLKEMINWDSGIAIFGMGAYLVNFLLLVSLACLFDFFYVGLKNKKIKGYWISFTLISMIIIYTFFYTISILINTNVY